VRIWHAIYRCIHPLSAKNNGLLTPFTTAKVTVLADAAEIQTSTYIQKGTTVAAYAWLVGEHGADALLALFTDALVALYRRQRTGCTA
jgi:hypothetical protein